MLLSSYDVPLATLRYTAAAASDVGVFSDPYLFFEIDTVGITYAVPLKVSETLRCIIAADLYVSSALGKLLEPLNEKGASVFAVTTGTHDLMASSSGVSMSTMNNSTGGFEITTADTADDFTLRTAAALLNSFSEASSVTVNTGASALTVTNKRLTKSNLDWTVLAVDAAVSSVEAVASVSAAGDTSIQSATCTLTIENDVAEATAYIVAEFMNRPVVAGQAVAYELSAIAETANLTASALAPTAQDSDLQKLLLRVVSAFGVRAAYVGFVDGTHIGVSVDEAGDYTGYFRSAGDDIDRATFPIDEDTGEQTSGTSLTYVSCFVLLNEWMRASQRLRLCSHLCVSASASLCVSACLSLCDESVHNIICI